MKQKKYITVDGNTAASNVAYAFSEVAAIYPITPSSPMGELADAWSAQGKKNMFGQPLHVQEMQSEAGAAGAIHGSLSAGAMTTTYTASQGLLLMLPNMYKIAGELLPAVFHVSARSLAYQSLSIFGDHSDVMAARQTGFAMIASSSIQEAQDMAAITHLATLKSKIPFLHFFDGFRTSHSIQKIEEVDYETLKSMIDVESVEDFRKRALNPENPFAKVGAQNPDVYFQGREVANKLYDEIPKIVEDYMKLYEEKTGRKYEPFMYHGAEDAEKIIIAMGSGSETIQETVEYLASKGEKVGAISVKLYRPFSTKLLIDKIPSTVKKIAVLDRTKESGSVGEPLYLDVVTSLLQEKRNDIEVIGGRYGLSSKEFTPSMINAVYQFLDSDKCHHNFTVGIEDDLSNTSIPVVDEIDTSEGKTVILRCKFWGYGSDGTVSANKNSIKIIGGNTDKFVQAYFSYDSKKSGGVTVSHLRISDDIIRSEYLLDKSDFIALHKESYITRYDILEGIKEGGIFLMNSIHPKEEVFANLTKDIQKIIIEKKLKFYIIDATKIAEESGLKGRINTVMQTAFFKISGVLPEKEAIEYTKEFVKKQFMRKGEEIVKMNWHCIDNALAAIEEVEVPESMESISNISSLEEHKFLDDNADDFAKKIIEPVMKMKGDNITVAEMTTDGCVPTATTKLEKRGVADNVPKWLSEKCIQCGQCTLVCPHAALRMKQIEPKDLEGAPKTFTTIKANSKNEKDLQFKIQCYPEDCMDCGLCVDACPTQALEMSPIQTERDAGENENEAFFESLPDNVLDGALPQTVKGTQLKTPLFEFSGACAGCGETPYVKLVTQLFGEDMIIANATGCSSIYGGTFPTVPYCKSKEGKGPAWANSLFEDNAEYGYGMRLAVDSNRMALKSNIECLIEIGTTEELKTALAELLENWNDREKSKDIAKKVKECLPKAQEEVYGEAEPILRKIVELQDYLSDKSVWIFGGDGWAYDIGYAGLDHALAQGKNVNVLVLDTEVYSNTGGQASKATPIGASAKFAFSGKPIAKKNLGLMMMTYGNIYVASVAMGANQNQLIKALREAEAYDGPSIVLAYSPCIAHGINMRKTQEEMKKAVQAGYWPLYRFNPDNVKEGKPALTWETPAQKMSYRDFIMSENRYKAVYNQNNDAANVLFDSAEEDARRRFADIMLLSEKTENKEESDKKE